MANNSSSRQARAVARRRFVPEVLIGLGLVLVTVSCYSPVTRCDFVGLDDNNYVAQCRPVREGLTAHGFAWAWSTFHASNWHPLTWLSLQLDATLFGPGPLGFHLTNLGLHAANVVLLFLVLRNMTGTLWPSATVAAVFAVHPLHVESVAWVAERKDVLSTFFGLLAIAAYAWYARRPRWGPYLLVCAAYAASLLAKPMLVTLPLLLLLLDWWPLRRLQIADLRFEIDDRKSPPDPPRSVFNLQSQICNLKSTPLRLLLEKLPLFALALASSIVTLVAQHWTYAAVTLSDQPLGARVANALWGIAAYLGQTVWPANLAVLYPLRPISWVEIFLAGALVAGITVAVFRQRHPAGMAGWLWFLVALVPVCGLVQVGAQARADRYTYVPHVGLFIAVVWLGADVLQRLQVPRAARAALVATLLLSLGIVTFRQVPHWENRLALWTRDLQVTEPEPGTKALVNMASSLENEAVYKPQKPGVKAGYLERARAYAERAVALAPRYALAHFTLAVTLYSMEKWDESRRHVMETLRLEPDFALAHERLGLLELRQGNLGEAEARFREALRLDPEMLTCEPLLGMVLARQRRLDEAAEYLVRTLERLPDDVRTLFALGDVRTKQGRLDEAAQCFTACTRRSPDFPEPYFALGVVELLAGRPDSAVPSLQKAASLVPQTMFLAHLAFALQESGQKTAAAQAYQAAYQRDPHWADTAIHDAWMTGTNPDARLRDGPRALLIARIACQSTTQPGPRYLDVLAAAYAAAGRFDDAVAALRRLPADAPADILARRKLYESRQAYHRPPQGVPAP